MITNSIETQSSKVSMWRSTVGLVLRGERFRLVLPAIFAVLAVAWPLASTSAYWLREGVLISVLALVVSGVNLSFGYAGELQLGQVFMFALGAYLTMILASRGHITDVVVLMIIGGLSAVVVGLLVAIPSLRIGGWSLAMASFFLVILIPDLASVFSKFTGGLNGLTSIPYPTIFGHQLGNEGLYEATAIATIVWFACYRNLITSRYGVIFRVMRTSTVLARSMGYSSVQLKTAVYAFGAFPAGVAGCLFGYASLIVQPGQFSLTLGIGAVAASVLGGTESVYGIFIGATLLQLGPEKSISFATYAPVAYGLFLIFAAILLRNGIAGLSRQGVRRLATMVAPEASLPPPRVSDVGETKSSILPSVKGQWLRVEGAYKSFGGVNAVHDVTLDASPASVTGLIGSNGSGKTTLLNLICGYNTTDRGIIRLGDDPITGNKAYRIARLGVGRTFQTPSIPTGVAVRDVVASGGYYRDHVGFVSSILRLPRYWHALTADRAKATELLTRVGLGHLAMSEAAKLPLGTRRLVEVVRALCGEPSVVLLDEPASGLNDTEVKRLGDILRQVAAAGTTVIVIEHNFRFVTSVSDRVHVMHLGELIASGTPQEIRSDPKVIQSYLGQSLERGEDEHSRSVPEVRPSRAVGEPSDHVLTIDAVDSGYGDLRVLRGVSLNVERGSVEVVLGRNGVGKTTLLSTVAGLLPVSNGTIRLDGEPISSRRPYTRASSGLCFVQEGKRVFRQRTVRENVLLGTYSLRMSRAERQTWCDEVLHDFPALKGMWDQRVMGLSGGQQQMVALAQALSSRPKVLLLDEPSAGLAPAIVGDLFARLRALADEGLTVVLVEQLAEKALAIADHVTVLDAGQVIASGLVGDFRNQDALDDAYFGAIQ